MSINLERHNEGISKFFADQTLSSSATTALIKNCARIMAAPAKLMLSQAGLSSETTEPFQLLDHGCGTGPVAAILQDCMDKDVLGKSKILCADVSEAMVGVVRDRAAGRTELDKGSGWLNVEAMTLNAVDSKQPSDSFSHVTTNFMMHIVPDPVAASQDVYRILRPSGHFSFTVWAIDNQGWIPDTRSSFQSLPFDAPLPDPVPMALHGKNEWIDVMGVEKELRAIGFTDVKVQELETRTRVENADDFVSTFKGMLDWIAGSSWEETSKAEAKELEGGVDAWIADHLNRKYGGEGWDTVWKSIIVTCVKP